MNSPLTTGMRLQGFCHGAFGRDGYGEKIIVASGVWDGKGRVVAELDNYRGKYLSLASDLSIDEAASWLTEEAS